MDRSNALHLISSSESSSSWRLPSASAESYISKRGDFHMMSVGSIASEPWGIAMNLASAGRQGMA